MRPSLATWVDSAHPTGLPHHDATDKRFERAPHWTGTTPRTRRQQDVLRVAWSRYGRTQGPVARAEALPTRVTGRPRTRPSRRSLQRLLGTAPPVDDGRIVEWSRRAGGRKMKARLLGFGCVEIDGTEYTHDVLIDRGQVRKRNKALSKPFRGSLGHTPLSMAEDIPWGGHQLIIGTGVD